MQQRNETDENACAYNDLALVKVDAPTSSKVNPSIPFWGGPVALNTDGTAAGDTRLLLRQLQPPRRHRAALPEAGHQPRHRGRGLDAPGLHRDPRRPR